MKRSAFSLLIVSAVLMLSAVNCHEIEPPVDPTEIIFTYGGYFLNAGMPGRNDAELSQLNTMQSSITPRAYSIYNDGKSFGDSGSDLHILGNNLYATLSGSKLIRVLNKFNCREVGTIKVESESGSTLTPSYLTSFEGALIVSCKEGYVARIDTTSLKQSLLQEVGGTPGRVVIANQKLYLSDGDRSVLMLNPVDLHVMKTVAVEPDPAQMVVDPTDESLYVISTGDKATGACLQRINTDTEEVTVITSVKEPVLIAAGNNKSLVIYVKDASADLGGTFLVYNTENQRVEGEFIRDGSFVRHPCMIAIDQNAGNLYIGENADTDFGTVYIYTSYGQLLASFHTGAPRPCAAVFVTGK